MKEEVSVVQHLDFQTLSENFQVSKGVEWQEKSGEILRFCISFYSKLSFAFNLISINPNFHNTDKQNVEC